MSRKNGKRLKTSEKELLSTRQKEVLQLAADGKTIEASGKELHLTGNTVDTHRRNIVSKLNAENITHAAVIGVRKKLIK